MSYNTIAQMAQDEALLLRVTACAATQRIPNPANWALVNSWALAATPGWDKDYAYAVDVGNKNPGWDGAVINDGAILSGVQARLQTLGATVLQA